MRKVHPMWIREIIKRLRKQEKILVICKGLGIHRSTIRRVRKLAETHDWLNPQKPLPDEEEIHLQYYANLKARIHPLDQFQEALKEWIKKGYSIKVMYQLVSSSVQCSETALRNYLKKHFPKPIDPVMVRKTIPGEVMEVDFGFLGLVLDDDNNMRKAWVFSGRFRHSRKTHREIVFSQDQNTFYECIIHALEFFGGVPAKVCLDNLKAGVIKWTVDLNQLNQAFLNLAEHYQFQISPCKPRHPQHKGGVENDMKYVKKNFWPLFKEEQRRKGHEVPLMSDAQKALDKWTEEVSEKRMVAQVGRTPCEIFETEEKDKLSPLPLSRWEPIVLAEAKVQKAWRVRFEKAFYTVPYKYIGKKVRIFATQKMVKFFYDFKEIAAHSRAKGEWEVMRKSEHAPPEYEEVLTATREGLLCWAEKIGECTYELIRRLFEDKKIDKLQPVRRILHLSKKYGENRLELACKRCLHYERFEYSAVKTILEEGREKEPLTTKVTKRKQEQFRYCRSNTDYGQTDLTTKGESDEAN